MVEVPAEELGAELAVGDGDDDQGDEELRPVARSTIRCDQRDAKQALRFAPSFRAGEPREKSPYHFKAGPAGGRLRRPSSASRTPTWLMSLGSRFLRRSPARDATGNAGPDP